MPFFWSFINVILRNKKLFNAAKSLRSVKRNGVKGFFSALKKRPPASLQNETYLSESDRLNQENTVFKKNIKISIVSSISNISQNALNEMFDSIMAQTYKNWELCLAGSSKAENENSMDFCTAYSKKDERIKIKKLDGVPVISEILNTALEMTTGDYIGIIEGGDILHPSAFFEIVKTVSQDESDFIYSDEAFFSDDHTILLKHHKPGYAVDTLRSHNYINHLALFHRSLMEKAGTFRSEFNGSHYYDLILRHTNSASRIHRIPKILYFSRNTNPDDNYHTSNAEDAIKEHLNSCNIPASVESNSSMPGFYRVNYELTERPLVSIIIPNKDNVNLLRNCISSIIKKTTYDNYEIIIVENNSKSSSTFRYYDELKKQSNLHIIYWEGKGFNYSKLCNYGAEHSGGKHLIFLNNDIEIISPAWIEEMLMYSQRNDVGAVGIKLYYQNGSIQHAGLILGMKETAGHIFLSEPNGTQGYMAKLQIVQNLSAVTAACMMVKKSVFMETGSFDPEFCSSFNDVDLCLKIRNAGYLIVWTPYAEAYHLEARSRGYNVTREKRRIHIRETRLFKKKWKKILDNGDPYYNINFSLEKNDYSLEN